MKTLFFLAVCFGVVLAAGCSAKAEVGDAAQTLTTRPKGPTGVGVGGGPTRPGQPAANTHLGKMVPTE